MTKQEQKITDLYSPEDLAENFVFPNALTARQKKDADESLRTELRQRRMAQTADFKVSGALLQLRYQIEDYVNDVNFDKRKSFGHFLKMYVDCFNKRHVEFAKEINVKPAELSQYINDHRKPPQHIMVRLELHSSNMIPAVDWYRLSEKATIHKLSTDKVMRRAEMKFVHNGRS